MAEPGRYRDDDARKPVPDKTAANGHVWDDRDGRDDDSRPHSLRHHLSTEQVGEYNRLVREAPLELAAVIVRGEEFDTR